MPKLHFLKYATLSSLLQEPKNIVITAHLNPDADAIGSSVGMASVLRKLGHKVHLIVPDAFPSFLQWMDQKGDILIFEKDAESAESHMEKAEVIFSLDYNALKRVGDELGNAIQKAEAYKVMIDHHQQPESFPDLTISDSSASSTAQLVYDFVEEMGWVNQLDKSGAEALYAGIMTDTGGFRFNSTSAHTHEVVAKLIEKGVKGDKVYNLINDQNTPHRLKLLGHLLANNMKVMTNFHTAYFTLSLAEKKDFHFQKGDTEGFVNYGLSMKGMKFAAFFTEDEDKVKISFRSKGNFNVNHFAREHFDGGGHNNAAGARSLLSLSDTCAKFEEILHSYTEELSSPHQE